MLWTKVASALEGLRNLIRLKLEVDGCNRSILYTAVHVGDAFRTSRGKSHITNLANTRCEINIFTVRIGYNLYLKVYLTTRTALILVMLVANFANIKKCK